MDAGPLQILEDKNCLAETAPGPTIPKLLHARREGNTQIEAYQLGDQGCSLEFHWPVTNSSAYSQVVHYGIVIDPSGQPKQLFKSGR